MASATGNERIRIGTLVKGNDLDPAGYIRQIFPHGFESFSLTFWQTLGGKDLPRLAQEVKEALADSGAVISSLAVYGNPLETQLGDVECLRAWEACIDSAHLFGADIVAGFTGRLRGRPVDESIPRFKEVFGELARRAPGDRVPDPHPPGGARAAAQGARVWPPLPPPVAAAGRPGARVRR